MSFLSRHLVFPFFVQSIKTAYSMHGHRMLSAVAPSFCPDEVFPEAMRPLIEDYLLPPLLHCGAFVARWTVVSIPVESSGSTMDAGQAFVGVLFEELAFRGLIQEGLLRQLPKRILPLKLVDHPLSRTARVLLSTTLFALAHTNQWQCGPAGGLMGRVAHGMLLGATTECIPGVTGIFFPVFFHYEWNFTPVFRSVKALCSAMY